MVVIINYYTPGNSSSFDVVATILYYPIFDLHCIYLLLHQKLHYCLVNHQVSTGSFVATTF